MQNPRRLRATPRSYLLPSPSTGKGRAVTTSNVIPQTTREVILGLTEPVTEPGETIAFVSDILNHLCANPGALRDAAGS